MAVILDLWSKNNSEKEDNVKNEFLMQDILKKKWYYTSFSVEWKKNMFYQISLVRYVILAISVAKIDFIVFMASLGVK